MRKINLLPKTIHRLITLAKTKRLVLATDASVDQGHVAHGFCFADKLYGNVIFSSGSKVEGPGEFLTSYRAEMISIIAASTLADTVLKSVSIVSTQISLYTDSETLITTSKNGKINTLHFVTSNDVDVALQLKKSILYCKQHISLTHVKGHQDKMKKS